MTLTSRNDVTKTRIIWFWRVWEGFREGLGKVLGKILGGVLGPGPIWPKILIL